AGGSQSPAVGTSRSPRANHWISTGTIVPRVGCYRARSATRCGCQVGGVPDGGVAGMDLSGGSERAVTPPAVRVPPAAPGALRPLARLIAGVTARATGGGAVRVFIHLARAP